MGTDIQRDSDITTAPRLPLDFWDQLEVQQACREQHFGRLLKAYRELQDPAITQTDLAEMLSLTQGQVSRIERGKTPVTNLTKLGRWARTLNIPASILWFEIPTDNESQPGKIKNDGSDIGEGDVRRRDLIKSVGVGAALLGTNGVQEVAVTSAPSYRTVGTESVEIMREWTRTFRRVDNRFGGGHALSQIGQYVSTEVAPKLKDSRCSQTVREQLFSAAAELYHLAGWMSYDIGSNEQGRKCLSQALRLCQDVGNHAYAAELLAGRSHQESYLRRSDDAVDFALAAKQAANKCGIHALAAEASVMAAHGFAQQGNKRSCLNELQEAEAEFCRIRSDEMPEWLAYFDEAYLSAKFGHSLKDLGEAQEAERFARRSLQMTDGYERGRLFNTALLASTLAMQGKVDEAVNHGQLAVQMASPMRSTRTTAYLTDVAQQLLPYKADRAVQALHKQMTARNIPLQKT